MKRIICLLALVILTSGCAAVTPRFDVSVDSINNKEAMIGKKCIILPAEKDVKVDDLQFKEYASYVNRALQMKQYMVTDNLDEANIAIFLGYGIGKPETHNYSYSVPVFGQTGVSSANTFGTAHTFGGTTTYSGITNYTPTYGVTGSNTVSGEEVTYTRYVFLDAYDIKQSKESKERIKDKQVWKTNITSTGSSGDLRLVFPALITAAAPYIGENTGQQVNISLPVDSKEILKIKGIEIEKKK